MASRDLRTWIALLEKEGELKRVKAKVDWNDEISQIIRKVYQQNGPALLFENIKGHENTFSTRLFTNGLGKQSRVNLMLNLPKDTPIPETTKVIKSRLKNPVKARMLKTGPVKENTIKGRNIDLFQIPVPKWHPLDGGRYINTYYRCRHQRPRYRHEQCGYISRHDNKQEQDKRAAHAHEGLGYNLRKVQGDG